MILLNGATRSYDNLVATARSPCRNGACRNRQTPKQRRRRSMEEFTLISIAAVAFVVLGTGLAFALRSRYGRRLPKSTYEADHQSDYEAAVRDVFRR